MKKLSTAILANLITTNRKKLSMTQQSLADATGINRSLISRMEKEDFLPSIPQLEQLGEVLGFEPTDVFTNGIHEKKKECTITYEHCCGRNRICWSVNRYSIGTKQSRHSCRYYPGKS